MSLSEYQPSSTKRSVTGHNGHWIKGAIKRPGALHRALGVPEGKKIPDSKIRAAEKRSGRVGREARFAEELKGFHKK